MPHAVSSRLPSAGDRPRPPWYLLAAMVMTWFIGMYGVTAGCETVAYLRQGNMPEAISATEQAQDARDFMRVAKLRAIAQAKVQTFPLAVAEALLSFVLIVGSVMAIAGRRGGRSLLTQALLANAVLVVVDYLLTSGVRGQYIAEVARAGPELFAHKQEPAGSFVPYLWWIERIKLVVFDLGALALALWAVHAKRSSAYFEAAAQAEDHPVEDNDEDV